MSLDITTRWEKRNLSEIAEIILGQSPPSSTYNKNGNGLPFFQGKAEFTETSPIVRQYSTASTKVALKDDILLSVRAPIGPTNVADRTCGIGRGLAAIRYPHNYKYLLYYFQLVQDSLDELGTGTTFRAITGPKLRSLKVPYAPLAEQDKIVTKIEELFSELDKNAHILEVELSRCDLLRASIIEYIYGGASSQPVKLSEVTDVITDGDHQAPPKSETGIPFIVISNIINNRVALERSTRYVPKSYYDGLKDSRKARSGDVLYTVTGSFGIPALVENDDKFCFQRHIALLRPTSGAISSKYLFYALQTDSVRKQATNIATGTAQLTVPLTGLRRISIPMIPLSKQQGLVEELELRLSELEGMMTSIRGSKLLAKKMKQSILSKAFKGELV